MSSLKLRCTTSLVACLCFTVLATSGVAEPPSILSVFRKKQPVPQGAMELKEEHGPWLILAATVSGDDAAEKAAALAQELRQELRLPAYVMHKSIGQSQTLATRDRERTDKYGNRKQYQLELKYANSQAIDAYAVMVGEFTSLEDPRIEEAMQRVRTAKPQALVEQAASASEEQADDTSWIVKKYRSVIWSRTDRESNLQKGPMGAAFLTRNPLLPDDYFEAPKLDKFVVDLNRTSDIRYSLLDCPGKYTVRVASFRGNEVTDFGNGSRASQMEEITAALDRAANKAHKLTEALRKAKPARPGEPGRPAVEAYEFHDRYGSYVTIGSFDSLGQQLESGQFQYHPSITEILNEYCGYRVIDVKDPETGAMSKMTSLKSEARIPFDIEGKPMAVPRSETAGLYRGSLLGGR